MHSFLLTSDTHFSDRPRDSHRFGLLRWLAQQQELHNVDATFLLGDLTEFKDRHSSKLVNQTIDELTRLRPPVYILRGNHDGLNPDNPFFKFLNCIEGMHFIIAPEEAMLGVFMIPHQRTQAEFDGACSIIKPKGQVMLHQTFDGAIAETGSRLTGLSVSPVASKRPVAVWAGDVHKPQQIGPVVYLGAPYHVRFGDNYTPRVLLVKDQDQTDLHFPSPSKWALQLTSAELPERVRKGDQVKIFLMLTREEVTEWPALKTKLLEACKERGCEVHGLELEIIGSEPERARGKSASVTPADVLKAYCKAEKVGAAVKQTGIDLL